MANKRKNIPRELLIELLEKNWGNNFQTRKDLAKNGYYCHRATLTRYIDEYELVEFVENLRDDFTEQCCDDLMKEAEKEVDNDVKKFFLNMRGHNIGWRPNEVKHQQDLEKIQAQKHADKDLLREQMRNKIMSMSCDDSE